MAKQYTISDGKLVLVLKESKAGGYVVSCPFDPELFTEGETIDEAVKNAHEVAVLLTEHRREMKLQTPAAKRGKPPAPRKRSKKSKPLAAAKA